MTFKPTIPGPDPDTRIPIFRLPALACDAHCHIFGPGSKYPYAPNRPYTPPDAPLEDFRALHRKLGVGRAVIVNASVHGTDDRVALDAIAASAIEQLVRSTVASLQAPAVEEPASRGAAAKAGPQKAPARR